MAYIEENIEKIRRDKKQGTGEEREAQTEVKPTKIEDDIVKFGDKYKTRGVEVKEGSLTSSLAMLSAIPEVDLGMECGLPTQFILHSLTSSFVSQGSTSEYRGNRKGKTSCSRRKAIAG
jgi:hypothetical protein